MKNLKVTADNLQTRGAVSPSRIETAISGREVVIRANAIGLKLLAEQLLRLANEGTENSHIHWDEASIIDKALIDIVVTKAFP